MDLAKPHLDVGLFTSRRDEQLSFWKHEAGLQYDHMARLGGGLQQHRFHANGSIIKVNHARDPLGDAPASGIAGVRIASAGIDSRRDLVDPDGNPVALVPNGEDGVVGIWIGLRVNNREAHDRFWREVMQFESPAPWTYTCGDTILGIVAEGRLDRATTYRAGGWRYLTVQIRDCAVEHAGVLARGGEEGAPPRWIGDEVHMSFVRDPDGNFIELSQRASLVGGVAAVRR